MPHGDTDHTHCLSEMVAAELEIQPHHTGGENWMLVARVANMALRVDVSSQVAYHKVWVTLLILELGVHRHHPCHTTSWVPGVFYTPSYLCEEYLHSHTRHSQRLHLHPQPPSLRSAFAGRRGPILALQIVKMSQRETPCCDPSVRSLDVACHVGVR